MNARPTMPSRSRTIVLASASLLLMSMWTLPMAVVGALPSKQARRFNAEVLARALARAILSLWGLQLMVHHRDRLRGGQTIFVSNHSSTIDLFVLIALGLPDTRFFLSGFLRWYFPLGIIAMSIGTFFTFPQTQPAKRARCFQRAEHVLRRTGSSVYLSPEGTRVTTGDIGPFNKGAFHLATNLGAPIVPLYIKIPKQIDPGKGFNAGRGRVEIFVQPPIATSDWTLTELNRHKEAVRDVFVDLHGELRTP